LEISIEEKNETCEKPESTNQDKECEFELTNENKADCEPTVQFSENSKLNKENPDVVLRENLKENISTDKEKHQEKDLKLILCSDILDQRVKNVDKITENISSKSVCNENLDTQLCPSRNHISEWTGLEEDKMELAEDVDNKVSLV
jgi:hypothetical protein